MRLMLDCNVVLDVLLDRAPHAEASSAVWAEIERGRAKGMIAAHSVTTIHCLLRRSEGSVRGLRIVRMILSVVGVAAVDQGVLQLALQSGGGDFEDAVTAVTAAAAKVAKCDVIVTRDPKEFKGLELKAMTPEVVMGLIRRA